MPETFGKYELVQKIAQGGMAEIFLATRKAELGGFEKQVAIKRIFRHLTGREETVNMFFDEARIAAQLHHPNIVQVYDLGEVEGYFYIAMEFVHGTDVRRVCKRGLERDNYLPIELATHIVAQTAAGLHYAHTRTDQEGNPRNIVHRDISPQNVLLSMDGHVKICDFGIAKAENRLARTRTGQFKGKLSYMSPEQFNGEDVDARSDVFNLGIVLYEITLARRLFDAKTDFERMRQIANAHVTPPSEVQSDYPPGLERIILKALRHDPDERYQSAEAVQLALEDWLHERGAKVGSVQVGDYMAEVFPELRDGIPENMAQVEFPADGREGESGGDVGVHERGGGLYESSSPEEPTSDVGSRRTPRGVGAADSSGELESEPSEDVGSVTVDPSKQPGRAGADQSGVEEPTQQVQRDDIRRTAEQKGPDVERSEPRPRTGPPDSPADAADTKVTQNPDPPSSAEEPPASAETARDRPAVGVDRADSGASNADIGDDAATDRQHRRRLAEGSSGVDDAAGGADREEVSHREETKRTDPDSGPSRRQRDSRPGPHRSGPSERPERRSPPEQSASTPPETPPSTPPGAGASEPSPQQPPSQRGPPGEPPDRDPPPTRRPSGQGPSEPGGEPSGGPRAAGERRAPGAQGREPDGGDDDLEPESALQRTWKRSVDIVTNGEDGLSNRQQRIIGYVVFAAGVVGVGIYLYVAMVHGTEHNIEEKTKKQKQMAAEIADAAADVDRTVDTPTVSKEVVTKPEGAHVVVNGAPVEKPTPTSVPLVKGEKNEMYLYKSGHAPKRVVVEAPGEKLPTYELEEVSEDETGVVQIKAKPKGATAFLDGKRVGTTPTGVKEVPLAGRHFLRLEKEGKESYFGLFEMRQDPEKETVLVPKMANAGGPSTGPYCEVVYDVIPQGTTIKANGEIQGRSRVAVSHTCGEYLNIRAWKEDYHDGRHYVHLRQPGKYLLKVNLEKVSREPGRVDIEVADDIRVFIGSNEYGTGSVEDLELRAGEYDAVFQPEGGMERFQAKVKVRPNKRTKYRFEIQGGSGSLERVGE